MNNQIMTNQQELQLINGRFTIADAERLLNELVQAKVRHHIRKIEQHTGSEEDIKAAEKRIKAIETDGRALTNQLKAIRATHQMVDISGLIVVQPVA